MNPLTLVAYLAVYILLGFYFTSFSRYGLNIWDEGGFAYGSWRTLNGQTAMKDFNPIGYLPGRYTFGALMFRLFGVDLQSLRLGMAWLTPMAVLMVFSMARRMMSPGFALLAAAMMLSAPSMYYNRFFPLFCVMNLFFLVNCLVRPGWLSKSLLAGTILLTVPFKPEVAMFSGLISSVVLGIYGGEARGKPPTKTPYGMLWLIRLSLLAGGLGLLIFLWQYDVFQKFVNIVTATHQVWGNPLPDLIPSDLDWEAGGIHVMFERILFYLPPLVYLLSGIYWLGMERTKHTLESAILMALIGFGVCAYGLVIWRAGFDNLVRTLPPFYILVCFYLHRLWLLVTPLELNRPFGSEPVSTWKTLPQRWILLAFPLVFILEMNSYHGFYAGSIGAAFQENRSLQMKRLNVYTNPVEARWVTEVVERIQHFSEPGDRILVLPLNPLFYFLSERENAIPHDWILPGMLSPEAQEKVVYQLKANLPKLVVLSDIPIDGREERRFSSYAPAIHHFIKEHYAKYGRVGLFEIHLPKRAPNELPSLPHKPLPQAFPLFQKDSPPHNKK